MKGKDDVITVEPVNSERFLSAFNQIHDFMKKELGEDNHIGFSEGLNKLRKKTIF